MTTLPPTEPDSPIYDELVSLGIVDRKSVVSYWPTVRDRSGISVFRCEQSGVIFLSTAEHVSLSYYERKPGASYWSSENRNAALAAAWEDDHRRAEQIRYLVANKRWLDVGSGLGGILDLLRPVAKEVHAIEPQRDMRELLIGLHYNVYPSIGSLGGSLSNAFEFCSMFHVFEHLAEPLESLRSLHRVLAPGAKIWIEVPHAGDALITSFNLDAFKKFTFWSEHLVLHTRQSLHTYLEAAGFAGITVRGFQRYPLANHLFWLMRGQPGGHARLPQFRDRRLEEAYAGVLQNLNQTDTLIAIAERP
jgi:SAM-dependent methyltransferase